MVPCHWIIQCDHVHRIYPIEIEIKNTTDTDLSALYIDHLDTDTRLLTATKYMCHIWSRICSVCRRQIMSFPLSLHISKYDLSSDFNTSCTLGTTSRTGTAYLSSSRFIGARASYSFVFCEVLCWPLTFRLFSFGHFMVCSFLSYGVWTPFSNL
jgi:hypothetical protein